MSFDIKKEARTTAKFFKEPGELPHVCTERQSVLEALLTRCRDATEEADIKAVCNACSLGQVPVQSPDDNWWLHGDDLCDASGIHHERRVREEEG